MTNKLITFTNRFKAASSSAGAADWISFFGETDARAIRAEWFGGLPWKKDGTIDPFWNNSPLKDVARVRTPTLLFAGEEDIRVPLSQVEEMYRGLVANGVRRASMSRHAKAISGANFGTKSSRPMPNSSGSIATSGAAPTRGSRLPPTVRNPAETRHFWSFFGHEVDSLREKFHKIESRFFGGPLR